MRRSLGATFFLLLAPVLDCCFFLFFFLLWKFWLLCNASKKTEKEKEENPTTARHIIKPKTTRYEFFTQGMKREQESTKGWGGVGGAKEKRKHLFGLRLQRQQRRRGPQGLQRTPLPPPPFFLFLLFGKSLALNCQAPIAPLLRSALHVDTGSHSDKLFFIFYYVRAWPPRRQASVLRRQEREGGEGDPSQDQRQRPDQVSPRQREGGGGRGGRV